MGVFGESNEQFGTYEKMSTTSTIHVNGMKHDPIDLILYSYFMPVCSIVKTIIPRCRGRPDALLQEAEGRVQ